MNHITNVTFVDAPLLFVAVILNDRLTLKCFDDISCKTLENCHSRCKKKI